MSSDRRQEDRVPTSFRVRLQYPDVDTFVERYATNVSRGGIFIQSQRTQPPGTLIRFEFQLQDKSAVIRGEGRVAWAVPFDPTHPERTYGMGVRFTRLDVKSKKIIDEMVSQRVARGERDPGVQPPSPEAARTEEALRAALQSSEAPAKASPPPPPPPPPPTPPPPPPPTPAPGSLGPVDSAPVRDMDLGAGGDVAVDVHALLTKTLGRHRVAAADADVLLAELAQGVDVSKVRTVPRDGARAAMAAQQPLPPRPVARSVPAAPPPRPRAPVVAAPPPPPPPPADAVEDSSVKRVMHDLFEEDSDVAQAPSGDEEVAPLPELQEVPVPAGERASAPAAPAAKAMPADLASLFDEDEGVGAATPPPKSEPAGEMADLFEGDVPEEDSKRGSIPEASEELLTALDEPLEDDFGARPSLPPTAPPSSVDLDTPIDDDFASAPRERSEVDSLLHEIAHESLSDVAPEGAEALPVDADDAPELEEEAVPVPILSDDDAKPKKGGFFKKLFGK